MGVCIGICWGPIAYIAITMAIWYVSLACMYAPFWCCTKASEYFGSGDTQHNTPYARLGSGWQIDWSTGKRRSAPPPTPANARVPLTDRQKQLHAYYSVQEGGRHHREPSQPIPQAVQLVQEALASADRPRAHLEPQNRAGGGGRPASVPTVLAEAIITVEAQPVRQGAE